MRGSSLSCAALPGRPKGIQKLAETDQLRLVRPLAADGDPDPISAGTAGRSRTMGRIERGGGGNSEAIRSVLKNGRRPVSYRDRALRGPTYQRPARSAVPILSPPMRAEPSSEPMLTYLRDWRTRCRASIGRAI